MPAAEGIPYLREFMVFLLSAGVVVPLFHYLRISPVLGYLVLGISLGPYGLGLMANDIGFLRYLVISEIEGVRTLAEFGIVFLLFMIGLDLPLTRLWGMRKLVVGMGGLQVIVTGAVLAGIAMTTGLTLLAAVILGLALTFSSTAMVMQLLMDHRRGGTVIGRSAFAMLLMQDLAVVPVLAFLAVLSGHTEGSLAAGLGLAFLKALVAVVAILLVGRLVLKPLFGYVSSLHRPELFMAVILLTVIGTAMITEASGLSMALGAFLAGLMLAESEYKHEVEVDMEPFKGLLLGLFFMSVGMGIDIRVFGQQTFGILAAVAGLFVIKAAIIAGLALLFRLPRAVAAETGVLMGQAGEFAFVIIGIALQADVLPATAGHFALLVVSLSLVLTPFMATAGRHLGAFVARRPVAEHIASHNLHLGHHENHVIIAGFGRIGHTVAKLLEAEDMPYIALDTDIATVSAARAAGQPVYFGDGSRVELLRRARADAAQALVITLDNAEAADHAVIAARREWPHLLIYARARDHAHAAELLKHGVTDVVLETVESSLQLGGRLLTGLGLSEGAVTRRLAQERNTASAILDVRNDT